MHMTSLVIQITNYTFKLEVYARNSNFGRGEPAVLTDPSIPGWPDQAIFRQITGGHKADLPILMENEIESYLQFQQVNSLLNCVCQYD